MEISLAKFFKKEDTSVLGVDIGSSSIKIVQIKKKGNKAVLETYGELSLGPYADMPVGQSTRLPSDKVAVAMTDLLNEKEVAVTTRNCGVAIPFHASLLSVIKMPEVKEKDLANMVPIEARKYIPVPISEVSLDWSIIPKVEIKEDVLESLEKKEEKDKNAQIGSIDVLIAAIHNNILGEYRDIVARSGLSASFFEIELFSSMRAILDDGAHSVAILDMGAASAKLYIVERGVLRSSHIINRGGQDITANIARINNISFEDAEIMKRNYGLESPEANVKEAITISSDYIFSEASRVIFTYESQFRANIEKVFLIGGGSAMKGWKDLAYQTLKREVVAGHPFSKTETPAFLDEVLKETGPEFAVAIGVALRKLYEV